MTTHSSHPIIGLALDLRLEGLPKMRVLVSQHSAPDAGMVTLAFGEGAGHSDVTLHASSVDIRKLSGLLSDAAIEIEAQWHERREGER